mmetsp:Transcript_42786/g.130086  ORF Transcript_42786/g.130086 Transcript_42786/m.130086 type:complete len:229 (-) Transcript_42786:39-725(-)
MYTAPSTVAAVGLMNFSNSSGFRPTVSRAAAFAYLTIVPGPLAATSPSSPSDASASDEPSSAAAGGPTTTHAVGAFHNALGTSSAPTISSQSDRPVRPSNDAIVVDANSRRAFDSNGLSVKDDAHSKPDSFLFAPPPFLFFPPFFFFFLAKRAEATARGREEEAAPKTGPAAGDIDGSDADGCTNALAVSTRAAFCNSRAVPPERRAAAAGAMLLRRHRMIYSARVGA